MITPRSGASTGSHVAVSCVLKATSTNRYDAKTWSPLLKNGVNSMGRLKVCESSPKVLPRSYISTAVLTSERMESTVSWLGSTSVTAARSNVDLADDGVDEQHMYTTCMRHGTDGCTNLGAFLLWGRTPCGLMLSGWRRTTPDDTVSATAFQIESRFTLFFVVLSSSDEGRDVVQDQRRIYR